MGGLEAMERVVTALDQPAGNAHGVGDLGIVNGIADEENRGGELPGFGNPLTAAVDFARSVNRVDAEQAVKKTGESGLFDQALEEILMGGAEDELGHAGILSGLEGLAGVGAGFAAVDAGVVGGDEFVGELFKGLGGEIKAQALVVALDGEVEDAGVSIAIELGQLPFAEHGIDDVDTKVAIVEEGSVPVPEDGLQLVGSFHGEWEGEGEKRKSGGEGIRD